MAGLGIKGPHVRHDGIRLRKQVLIGLFVLVGVSLFGAGAAEPPKSSSLQGVTMTIRTLQSLLVEAVQELKGDSGQWRCTFADVEIALLTSVAHDRMRITALIGSEAELTN